MNFLFFAFDLFFLLGLVWLIYHYISKGFLSKKWFLFTLGLKICAGVGVGLLYLFYYKGGDTFSYFYHSLELTGIFKDDSMKYIQVLFFNHVWENMPYPEEPRALFMVKLVSLVDLITYNNYWWVSVFLSFFCFSGLLAWAKTLGLIYPNKKQAIVFSILLFPSLIFWSSGIMKETIALGAMGFLMSYFLGYVFALRKFKLYDLIINGFMLWLLWNTKYYYCGVFLLIAPAVGITLMIKKYTAIIGRNVYYQLILCMVAGSIILGILTLLHPNFQLDRIGEVMVRNYYDYQKISNAGDVFQLEGLQPDFFNLVLHAPKALFSGLFRPLPGESKDILKILSGLENILLFILTISAFFKLPSILSLENRLLLLGSIVYCFILALFLAFSTPNFGTLARYKVGFLPVLLLIISINNPLFNKVKPLIK